MLHKPPSSHSHPAAAAAAERSYARRTRWRREIASSRFADPQLSPPNPDAKATVLSSAQVQLITQGIDLVADTATFPPGTRVEDLPCYPGIVRAFSRTFGPNLFSEMNYEEPVPALPYWNTFFSQISNNPAGLRVVVQHSESKTCAGTDGVYQDGTIMWLYDCTDEPDVFHEIGHAVMQDGILKKRAPLYFHYAASDANGQAQVIDAKDWLNHWFGKTLDTGYDTDGAPTGFVSEYAKNNQMEDFAETFKWYVYYPDELWAKIERQTANGSSTLRNKAQLIGMLYAGFWFKDNGVPGGWPGFSL